MRTGSSVRSVGSLVSVLTTTARGWTFGLGLFVRLLACFLVVACFLGLDDVDAHLAEHGEDVLDLLGIDLLGGQYRVDLVVGNVAAFLGGADELLDGGVGEIKERQRGIRSLGAFLFGRLVLLLFRGCLGLARHASLPERPSGRSPCEGPLHYAR